LGRTWNQSWWGLL